jgi:hypothetical protein
MGDKIQLRSIQVKEPVGMRRLDPSFVSDFEFLLVFFFAIGYLESTI